ncbi:MULTISPECIES: hypothetical protein [Pseudomonas]|uniref:Uncharacterized protein n=2 Tax=Pseudomonas chlororaphis TaxID=587753 RepID=A0AAD0ZMR1_9PSED|nr:MULTISPECIES: hypothetical protein [Pseudomonas]AZE01008.1 hypothetical protein C4K12_5165 [Pseudomonas chlororaphis subsp. aureofaciens]AZE07122.1 hypothetical protein C4K11_4984 [Pseudomonas chlororaphis subsp. aureofaciens]AZE13308.1 hypothetical protein C4K10_5052 [Pseudomonas chlororaphis subsp. aureofaciens]AZE19263.1 hypothetical protein C4K09_4826 [Pseudomonas chlororaphis subsp. aureofaciens]AZE31889.1 hypothetical protein C4K07_5128 [Pseudomonas chlororaphis subsp. aureofaciens]
MSHPGKSVFLFGLYMLLLGAALVLAPNLLLPLFGFALTDEVWIRVMGQLALYLGVYYVWAGYTERREFMALTVAIRLSVPVFFAAFVAAGLISPVLLLLALPDLCSALWTWCALKAPTASRQPPGHA